MKDIKKTINTEVPKTSNSRLHDISMNNYVRPDYRDLYYNFGEYVLNGIDNQYYQFVEDRYYGSPTSAAIIDSYCRYIYGDGLVADGMTMSEVLSNRDLRLIIQDFKMQGQAAIQVIYNKDRSIAELAYVPIKSVGVNRQDDMAMAPQFYWYSYDWNYRTKFEPVLLPAFGTSKEATELLVIRSTSNLPYFSLPDYQTGLQYCQLEEELSNYFINHVMNGLSFGHIINVFGVEEDDDSQDAAEKSFVKKLTGSGNAGKFILSFQDDPEKKTTIESVPVSDAHEQYQFLTNYAKEQILMAHKVTNPILFGIKDASGFSSNADEMVMALKTLYRSQINPIREEIIDGLNEIFPDINLRFEDFEELRVDNEPISDEVVVEEPTQDNVTTDIIE